MSSRRARVIVGWLACLVLAACGDTPSAEPTLPPLPPTTPPSPSPPPPPAPAPGPFGAALAAIPTATAVRVTDGWMGLSPIAPIEHHYELTQVGAVFSGHVVCRARGQDFALPDVVIPSANVAPLLARLSTLSAISGDYTPRIEHTDDYPDRTMEVATPGGVVTFHSRSQGELSEPWAITTPSESGVVESTVPGEVMREILVLLGAPRCREWAQGLAHTR